MMSIDANIMPTNDTKQCFRHKVGVVVVNVCISSNLREELAWVVDKFKTMLFALLRMWPLVTYSYCFEIAFTGAFLALQTTVI